MSQPYVYKAVTLSATGSVQNLLAALQAIDSSIVGAYREINLQSDPSNSPTTALILIGDDQLSPTRVGFSITDGTSHNLREGLMAGVPIANIYFLASTGTQKLNVELIM